MDLLREWTKLYRAQLAIAKDKTASASARIAAGKSADKYLGKIAEEQARREQEAAKAQRPAEERRPMGDQTRRTFLLGQARDLQEDLARVRSRPGNPAAAVAQLNSQLLKVRNELDKLEGEERDQDPYKGLSPQEKVDLLTQDVLPYVDDLVLLASIREYATRKNVRVVLHTLEEGVNGVVELLPTGGWQAA